jgi:putative peptidoglycan binding protein/transglycosylase-like protein with SLT domain
VARRLALFGAAALAGLTLVGVAQPRSPHTAALQAALRAHGLYGGAIDGIPGPMTRRATKRFQRRAGLVVDGRVGPATRHALGPLGRPSFATRAMHRNLMGWDVSVLQFLLTLRGDPVPVTGYFGTLTDQALRRYQHSHGLSADGIAGRATIASLTHGRRSEHVRGAGPPPAAASSVRAMLNSWADVYGVDPGLVRALAWMESGFQPGLVSKAGARGVLQVLPGTRKYVQTVLLGHSVPNTTSGNIRIGVVFLRQLLREFGGNESRALAGWYQGPASVRRHGPLTVTRRFVANVLALRRRGV